MPTTETRHFGCREYSDESVIHMPDGLPGFETETAFLLLQIPDQHPLVYLQSTHTPGLCFTALPVLAADIHYRLGLLPEDSQALAVREEPVIGKDVLCLVLIAANETGATANMLAPVVINLRSQTGMQCINVAGYYSHQHQLTRAREVVGA